MPEISINNKKYKILGTGSLDDNGSISVIKINNEHEVNNNYCDDIIIKDSKGQLFAISADEIDIKGTLLNPYLGLPKVNDQIILYGDNGEIILEGIVISSQPEDDHLTMMDSYHEDN